MKDRSTLGESKTSPQGDKKKSTTLESAGVATKAWTNTGGSEQLPPPPPLLTEVTGLPLSSKYATHLYAHQMEMRFKEHWRKAQGTKPN
jgi:hypothetical protein